MRPFEQSKIIITQIGPYPPPYGGVAKNVKRLRKQLQQAGFEVPVWCYSSIQQTEVGVHNLPVRKRPMCYVGWIWDSFRKLTGDVIHFHDLGSHSLWVLITLLRGQKCVVSIHNQFQLEGSGFFLWLSRATVRLIGAHPHCRWIAVSDRIAKQLRDLGALAEHISVLPSFLPSEKPTCTEDLPIEILEFAAKHQPLLTVYGFYCRKLPGEGDLYGIDVSLEALVVIRKQWPNVGLIILIPNEQKEAYFHELYLKASRLNLQEVVLWWTESLEEASPLWALSDVYLRPTTTDGDATSIREALAVGTPVVASDASKRPEGTLVFPSKDLTAFVSAIEVALANGRCQTESNDQNGFNKFMRVYSELIPISKEKNKLK